MRGVCVITGGARGIGAATARLVAADGHAVAVGYREREEGARAVVAAIEAAGGRAAAIRGDVVSEADIVRLFDEAERTLGPVGMVVNAAGIGHRSPVRDFGEAELARLMAVNVTGLMIACRESVRRMSGRGGVIVNVSSMAATIGGRPAASAYAASKAAVDCFTRGLAKEVATDGIRVNAVRPGVTRTDMTSDMLAGEEQRARVEATIAMARVAEATEVAEAIRFLLSPAASFISGALLDVSGGGFVIGDRD